MGAWQLVSQRPAELQETALRRPVRLLRLFVVRRGELFEQPLLWTARMHGAMAHVQELCFSLVPCARLLCPRTACEQGRGSVGRCRGAPNERAATLLTSLLPPDVRKRMSDDVRL